MSVRGAKREALLTRRTDAQTLLIVTLYVDISRMLSRNTASSILATLRSIAMTCMQRKMITDGLLSL